MQNHEALPVMQSRLVALIPARLALKHRSDNQQDRWLDYRHKRRIKTGLS